MEPEQIPELIAQIALADPRVKRDDKVERRAQILMWAGILTDVPYDFAIRAAQQHYAEKVWPVLPADIATRWAATVRDRMNRDADPEPHGVDPDDEQAYRAQLAARRRAVAHGHTAPVEAHELTAAPDEVQERLSRIGRYIPDHARDALASYRPVRAARERLVRTGQPDPLAVSCPWCGATVDQACRGRRVTPGRDPESKRQGARAPHPSRLEAARSHPNAA
ncbi:hypothetical protein ACFY15_00530 [Streptomyces sp. NPDC001373]|uniref:zinc finger domain-containing protein n=1 Tax=Streptomyces sp. NPDC001373 TaxID=3364565 RepID=UPI0036CB337C